jgi:hypothetical protein
MLQEVVGEIFLVSKTWCWCGMFRHTELVMFGCVRPLKHTCSVLVDLHSHTHNYFTVSKVRHPQTNGKAERVIKTLMELWHEKTIFKNREHRKKELIRFVNYYNTVKPHAGIDGDTPLERLLHYFYPSEL